MSIKDTKWFVIGTGIAWLAVDIHLVLSDKTTISRIIVDATYQVALPVMLLIGYLLGHWTFPQVKKK